MKMMIPTGTVLVVFMVLLQTSHQEAGNEPQITDLRDGEQSDKTGADGNCYGNAKEPTWTRIKVVETAEHGGDEVCECQHETTIDINLYGKGWWSKSILDNETLHTWILPVIMNLFLVILAAILFMRNMPPQPLRLLAHYVNETQGETLRETTELWIPFLDPNSPSWALVDRLNVDTHERFISFHHVTPEEMAAHKKEHSYIAREDAQESGDNTD